MSVNVLLGQVIARRRKDLGFSQEELANKSGVHRTYISQIERGLKSPTLNVLIEIAKELHSDAAEILTEIEQRGDLSQE